MKAIYYTTEPLCSNFNSANYPEKLQSPISRFNLCTVHTGQFLSWQSCPTKFFVSLTQKEHQPTWTRS